MTAAVLGWLGRLWAFWLARLSERSTWGGILLIAAAKGHDIPKPVMDALQFWGPIIAAGLIAADTGGGKRAAGE